ncbi:MAG: hypothetical protein M3Q69_09045 [Acidobacteriota bacterium]|nr:hypothetical protein [Acidobacteriota bacterium]
MDQEALVTEFHKAAATVEKLYGPVSLLLLVAPDEQTTDAWNVIVSADGLDSKPRGEAVRVFTDSLRKSLSQVLWRVVARATVLRTTDPFVTAFNSRYAALSAGAALDAVSVAGVELPRVVVVEASRRAA